MTERAVVCVSTTDWNEVWGSRQQIMTELAKSRRVVYVERQVGPEHLWKYPQLRGRFREPERREKDGVTLLRPPLMPPARYYSRLLDDRAQGMLATWLKPRLSELGVRDFVLWVYPPNSHRLPALLEPRRSVYHCIDRFAGQSTGRKRAIILEEERDTLRAVDVCLAYSRSVHESHAPVARACHFWPNGCDFERIRATMTTEGPEPADLAKIPRPRMGHMGSVAGKTDLDLIDRLSREHPGWQFVFVGAEYPHDLDYPRWCELKARANIHHLGPKPIAEVPAYEKGFDACLMLWRIDAWTRELQPIKIFEYLATGRPVVSTLLPELDFLKEGMVLTGDFNAFRDACAAVVAGRHPVSSSAQLALAERYSWPNRLKEAFAWIEGQDINGDN